MILGISTNTRLLGLAIINQGRLVDYSIHLFKSPWSASKANKIVTSLEPCVRQYCIKNVVLSIPHEYHQNSAIKNLLSRIRRYVSSKGIALSQKTPETLHSLYPTQYKKTKKRLMHELTLLYPQLTYCYLKEMQNKKRYYHKLFEAVAVGVVKDRER
jgi:RNase H-fold protein (predicted Holliday junction resolvase)